jgi:nicotinate dehydrogenase subunit B
MPGFGDHMSDDQIAELVGYLRQQFAPGRPAWTDIRSTVAHIRASANNATQ